MTEKKSHNKITFIFSKDMHDLLLPYIVSGRQPELTVSIPFDVFTFCKSAFYLYYKLCTCKNIYVTLAFRLLTKRQASCGCRDSTSNRLQLRRSKLGRQPCHKCMQFKRSEQHPDKVRILPPQLSDPNACTSKCDVKVTFGLHNLA